MAYKAAVSPILGYAILLLGVHLLKGTSLCRSLSKVGQLDGYIVAIGSQLIL